VARPCFRAGRYHFHINAHAKTGSGHERRKVRNSNLLINYVMHTWLYEFQDLMMAEAAINSAEGDAKTE